MIRIISRPLALAGLAVVSTTAALSMGVGVAHADSVTPPPYEDGSNTSETGTISFEDANGVPVVTGSTTASPFAMYAIGSQTLRAGDNKATLEQCQPKVGVDPSSWTCEAYNGLTPYPVTKAGTPSNVSSQTNPVSTLTSAALEISDVDGDDPPATTGAYAGYVQLRLITVGGAGSKQSPTYSAADFYISPDGSTFTQVYPTPATTAPPALAEAPLAIGLPLAAVAVGGGIVALRRRRAARA